MNKEQTLEFLDILIALLPEEDKQALVDFRAKIAGDEEPVEEEVIENKIKSLIKNQSFVTIKQFEELRDKVLNFSNNKPQITMENRKTILNSKTYTQEFLNTLMQHGNDKDARVKAIIDLQIKNGITGDEIFYPSEILTGIEDNLTRDNHFLGRLRHLGTKDITIPRALLGDNEETERAYGHKKGKEKSMQVVNLTSKMLHSQEILKIIELNYETLRKVDGTIGLMKWVIDELTTNIINEIERAILIGDGRDASSDRKISSFEVLAEAKDANYITALTATDNLRLDIRKAVKAVKGDGARTLFISGETLVALQQFTYASGGTTTFTDIEVLKRELGVDNIVEKDYINEDNGVLAIVLNEKYYGIVGDTAPERIEGYDIKKNQQNIEMVGLFGGGLIKVHTASVVKPA
jgi:hypothetical protein